MRQQSGLVKYQFCHRLEIGQRRRISQRVECGSRGTVTKLRFVTEGKERFATAGRLAGARDVKNLIRAQEWLFEPMRRLSKCAVVTNITAQSGQRDEDFSRIGNDMAMCSVAPAGSRAEQRGEVINPEEGVTRIRRPPVVIECVHVAPH